MLFGLKGSEKSSLIDYMCNYFYGAKFDGERYKIANEVRLPLLVVLTFHFSGGDQHCRYSPKMLGSYIF